MNKKWKRVWCAAAVLATSSAGLVSIPWLATHHEQVPLVDAARNNRSVPVDVYSRSDKRMQAELGMTDKMPVVIISHGNTVKSSEYSFVAKLFALRGYLALSIQHDLPGDPSLAPVNKQGTPYVSRWDRYMRASANIDFVVNYFKQEMPFADYDRLTLLGHSQGGDDSMFYARSHPYTVARVIALDNLRMPPGLTEILSIRGNNKDNFTPDPGVVPDCEDKNATIDKDACEEGNITIYWSRDHHTLLSDRGPKKLQDQLTDFISKYLEGEKSRPKRPPNLANDPAMGPEYRPLPREPY